ncbi:hypothetical protein K437DRAFT_253282 [Tilletiaria anomala UBC 951]|uniref:Uncharacterized protein n=1 Tax=Tilletiaria anomala (strain ATCC 24038 / CBS 436.72 / UBC 951) TaxID=1037660 RepID=A0A066WQH2_TILAU|nr:uncharacterized protein K437DRAFT_253282 [Tilletiaria anomala UBC 951]KDN53264.1 hypothetical protein K437DRAFT_253282 [Tilletiaria anomala UBC 951]
MQHATSHGGYGAPASGTESPAGVTAGGKRKRKQAKSHAALTSQQQQAAAAAHAHAQQQALLVAQQQQSMSSGMALGIAMDDEATELALDDLDRHTPRDLAIARYKRGHELLAMIFDARKMEHLRPGPSPYAGFTPKKLEERVQQLRSATTELQDSHAEKMRKLKESLAIKAWPTEDDDADYGQLEEWARRPASGRILGVGLVRAPTPEIANEQRAAEQSAVGASDRPADATMEDGSGDGFGKSGEGGQTEEERIRHEAEVIDQINKEHGENIPSGIPPIVAEPLGLDQQADPSFSSLSTALSPKAQPLAAAAADDADAGSTAGQQSQKTEPADVAAPAAALLAEVPDTARVPEEAASGADPQRTGAVPPPAASATGDAMDVDVPTATDANATEEDAAQPAAEVETGQEADTAPTSAAAEAGARGERGRYGTHISGC